MRRLFIFPIAALVVFTIGQVLLGGEALRVFNRIEVLAVAALAAFGCAAAASGFERGEYLRQAWYVNGASYLFVAAGAAMRIPPPSDAVYVTRGVLTVIANFLGVASMWLFARAYKAAGLELPGSRLRKAAIGGTAALLALLAAGPPLYFNIKEIVGGGPEGFIGAASSTGDIITFVLIAPVFMTALALRGGLLVWPWALFTAANVAWLLFDAQDTVTIFLPKLIGQTLEDYTEPWRILACVLTFCAGMAQRRLSAGTESEIPVSS